METDIATSTKYIATSCGQVIGPSGKVLKPIVKKNGYTHFSMSEGYGKPNQTLTHRFVYEYFHGPIPAHLEVDHIDSNRLNNAIDNLQLLSPKENCRKSSGILNMQTAREIRARRNSGESGAHLAKEFGVSQQTICDVIKHRKWKEEEIKLGT